MAKTIVKPSPDEPRAFTEFDRWAISSFRQLVGRHAESDNSGGAISRRDSAFRVLDQPDRQSLLAEARKLRSSEKYYLTQLLERALNEEHLAGPPGMDSLPSETILKEVYDIVRSSEKHYE